MTSPKYSFALLPYLKTTGRVKYRDLTIASTEDTNGLPLDAITHLRALQSMFFLRDHLRIRRMCYAFHSTSESLTTSEFMRQLDEFRILLAYVYSMPRGDFDDLFLVQEHSSVFLCQPSRISSYSVLEAKNTDVLPEFKSRHTGLGEDIEGYQVLLNHMTTFPVVPGSRIYPPTQNLWLNISQDLEKDFNYLVPMSSLYKPVIQYISTTGTDSHMGQRVMTALTWYARSTALDIDATVALLNLAIAFESLLGLEQAPTITERFREAVALLVGDIPRLDSWLRQFYKARSDIVHGGRSDNLMFFATDRPVTPTKDAALEYRPLVSYGRQLFQVCAAAVATGTQLAGRLKLASMLVTNQERLQRICQRLSQADGTPDERIRSCRGDILDIDDYRYVLEKGLTYDQSMGAARLLVRQYVQAACFDRSDPVDALKRFAEVDLGDQLQALSMLEEILQTYERTYIMSAPTDSTSHIVRTLLNCVWHYNFLLYFNLKRNRE